jgi:hypothetical protein
LEKTEIAGTVRAQPVSLGDDPHIRPL